MCNNRVAGKKALRVRVSIGCNVDQDYFNDFGTMRVESVATEEQRTTNIFTVFCICFYKGTKWRCRKQKVVMM